MKTMRALSKSLSKALAVVCVLSLLAPIGAQAATNSGEKANISEATVTVANQTYNGKSQTAKVTVKYGDATLVAGTDYTVTGNTNKNAGTYKVTVTGQGNYTGSVEKSYKINPKSISKVSATAKAVTYNGKSQTADVVVKDGTATLKKGTDYTLSGATKGTAAKKYEITVTGKGNYNGTKKVTFQINAKSISKASVSVAAATYTGKKLTGKVTVKDGSKALKAGTDYSVKGNTGTKAGKYTVTVTGKGNYSGSVKKDFTINKAAQKITVTAPAVKASDVAKKAKTVKLTVKNVKEKAKLSYKSSNKNFTVKDGKVTIKKGTKKGAKATITVSAAATTNYKKATAKVTITVK